MKFGLNNLNKYILVLFCACCLQPGGLFAQEAGNPGGQTVQSYPAPQSLPVQLPAGMTVQSLTPGQRQAAQAEMSKTGGQLTPEAIETLKKSPEFKDLKPENSVEGKKIIPLVSEGKKEPPKTKAEEAAEPTQQEKGVAQPLKRFGMGFFKPARNRIVEMERMIGEGRPFPVIQRDALSGFVGPLDMVSSYVNVTIPSDAILNPGDRVIVYYWGDMIELTTVQLKLDEGGEVSIPKVGKLVARGMTLTQFENVVRQQLQRVFGKSINLITTLDTLKSIQIFITGETFRPGSYAVSAVTTLFNALYASGGPNDSGSLREIKLLRNNKTISVDFYDYLLNGDSKYDYPLQPGDTIFISKSGKVASIDGEVNRPGLFELKGNERLKDLIGLANGIKPTGIVQKVQIKSVIPNKEKVLIDVDIRGDAASSNPELFDGDSVTVSPVLPEIVNIVYLEGKVMRPGKYEFKKDMRVSDLFSGINKPLGEAYLERADIVRLNKDMKTTTLISINMGKALAKDQGHDILLSPLDRVIVYSKWDVKFLPPRRVVITGAVQRPADYERSDGMRVKDLLVMAGGVLPNAFLERADLTRYDFEKEITTIIPVDMKKLLEGDENENLQLTDRDSLRIYTTNEITYTPEHIVTIKGSVQRPGEYTRSDGMKLKDLFLAAGGVLPDAHDIVDIAKARKDGKTEIKTVNLTLLNRNDESQNVLIDDGDIVMVRTKSEFYYKPRWVTITGEVRMPGTYPLYGKDDRLSDLIERAGGLIKSAYAKGTVVMRKKENLPSNEQRTDVTTVNRIAEMLNVYEYDRQSVRNQYLLQKEYGKTGLPPIAMGGGSSVIASGGTAREAVAVGMAPSIAMASGQVVGGAFETMESLPGVVSKSRKMGDQELMQSQRVIIRLGNALTDKGGEDDLILMSDDSVYIPQKVDTVSVIGAVMRPTTIEFGKGQKYMHYVALAGGFTDDANRERTLVIRVDGSILSADKVKLIEEGDIVYVPPKVMSLDIVERIDKIIDVVKFTLTTAASVVVFIALLGLL